MGRVRPDGYWRERSAKRRQDAAYREQQAIWYKDWYERHKDDLEYKRKSAEKMRESVNDPTRRHKHVARWILRRRVKTGAIVKLPCEICGEKKVEAHHEDYSKPLDVRWLCRKHHREVHKQAKATGQ